MKLAGSMVALVTPMDEGGTVNDRDLQRLIDWHVTARTDALVIAGTTGESATLDHDEHVALIERACKHAEGRIAIVAGTGSNSTVQTLSLSREVDRLPVAGFLVVTPYYNKPTQEGLVRHFSAVADAVSRPVILYNVPGRTAVDMTVETTARLARHGNVIGVKDATGELDRVTSLRQQCDDDFMLLSGDDATSCEFMLMGGNGVISVTANVAPAAMKALCDTATRGQREQAEHIDAELQGLHHALFCESNPIPVKWALQQMGWIGPGIRLPLTPLSPHCYQAVLDAMARAGIAKEAAQ